MRGEMRGIIRTALEDGTILIECPYCHKLLDRKLVMSKLETRLPIRCPHDNCERNIAFEDSIVIDNIFYFQQWSKGAVATSKVEIETPKSSSEEQEGIIKLTLEGNKDSKNHKESYLFTRETLNRLHKQVTFAIQNLEACEEFWTRSCLKEETPAHLFLETTEEGI